MSNIHDVFYIVDVMCRLLMCFSVLYNTSRLLTVRSTGDTTLDAVHGVRFLSMTWVILGHTFFFMIYVTSKWISKY